MIRAVIFDMFETLVTLFEGRTYFSEDIAADMNIPYTDFRREWHATEHDRSIGKYSIKDGLEIAFKKIGVYTEEDVNRIAQKRIDALGDTFLNIPDDSILLLKKLRERNILTGLITNTFSDERDYIVKSELYPLFDVSLISYETGKCKPDREIYRLMVDKLSIDPDECLYVGDGGSRELFAARDFGMHAVQAAWFRDRAFEPHIPCPELPEFEQAYSQMDILKLVDSIS